MAEPLGRGQAAIPLLDEPGRITEAEIQLVELPGEIFVMQVQPVVLREIARDDLVIPDRRVFDASILQGQRHGIVPWWSLWRRVDRDLGRPFQRYGVHVVARD